MPSLFDLIEKKLELYRLEKRYTRRRNRRSTFISDAVYVDGEYYSANTSYTAKCTAGTDSDSGSKSSKAESQASKDTTGNSSVASTTASTVVSKSKRLSLMDWRRGSGRESKQSEGTRVSVREMKWDGSVRS